MKYAKAFVSNEQRFYACLKLCWMEKEEERREGGKELCVSFV
jgi:hypothetical protein